MENITLVINGGFSSFNKMLGIFGATKMIFGLVFILLLFSLFESIYVLSKLSLTVLFKKVMDSKKGASHE